MKTTHLDIRNIAQKAGRFKQYMEMVKVGLGEPGFAWYPYDSMGSFYTLADLLTGDRRFLLDLIGDKPVVDVGCGDGTVAFFLESLGCKVFAIDNPRTNFNQMRGVRALKAALNSSIEISEQDIDHDLRLPDHYGLAVVFGVLYHLKNPFRVLETLVARSQYCLLSTRVARFAPKRKVDLGDLPVAYLLGDTEINNDATNYWIFTNPGLKLLLARSGWRVADYTTVGNTLASDPIDPQADERAFCLAEMTGGSITTGRLLSGWHDQNCLEDWRWTEKKFAVAFSEIPSESQFVRLGFFLPAVIEESFGGVELGVTVNGHQLPTRSFTKSAVYQYEEPIPESALADRPVILEFSLSEALPPSEQDRRELGIVVTSVSL